MATRILPSLFAACLCLTGCGPSKVNVEGTVVNGGQPYTLKADEFLTVNVSSEDGSASFNGKVTAEGKFAIETADNKGILPGKYKVILNRYGSPAATGGKPAPPVTLEANEVWDVSSSNHTFTIDLAKYKQLGAVPAIAKP